MTMTLLIKLQHAVETRANRCFLTPIEYFFGTICFFILFSIPFGYIKNGSFVEITLHNRHWECDITKTAESKREKKFRMIVNKGTLIRFTVGWVVDTLFILFNNISTMLSILLFSWLIILFYCCFRSLFVFVCVSLLLKFTRGSNLATFNALSCAEKLCEQIKGMEINVL